MLHPNGPTPAGVGRRHFVKTLSAAGVGLALGGATALAQAGGPRQRYAIVGTGSRSRMYQDAIETTYRDHAQLVAVCDKNPGRLEVARRRAESHQATPPPAYGPEDFERMIKE